ncbi:voltage-gated potassium channel [Hysterangium stoloniferum]|nr:voltage-gated potassium channel [Hysterangium stoloniferum]
MPTSRRLSKAVLYLYSWAKVVPLLAAIFAPFSILFDIPALSEPWFVDSDSDIFVIPARVTPLPDPKGNVALSAVGLLFNVIANALLIVRFSTGASARWWRVATRLSLVSWICKVVIALINVVVYGTGLRPHSIRWEGLWCAIVSLVLCGVITALLIFHWILEPRIGRKEPTEDQLSIRVAGRLFMMNVIFFVIDVALLALLSSKVEHWTYFQGIYFTVVTFLTIGYGDFKPLHTVTRVLVFMFAILGIAQLGNIVTMLVRFFASRVEATRAESRAQFEEKRKEELEGRVGLTPDLFQEIQFLERMGEQQLSRIRLRQVITSLAGLIVFWVVGAAIFSHLEGTAYGTGLYFIYVSFLTIGYGDYAPITPAGRVLFVLYVLLAVPIMASLAVQAVQQVLYAISERAHDKRKTELGLKPELTKNVGMPDSRPYNHVVVPHANLAEQWHEDWERQVRLHRAEGFSKHSAIKLANVDVNAARERERIIASECHEIDEEAAASSSREQQGVRWQQEKKLDEEALLTEKILEYAISLESRARKLLITHLDEEDGGKSARIVLKADQNVQMREVKVLLREIAQEKEEMGEGGDEGARMDTTGKPGGDDPAPQKETFTSRYSRFQSSRTAGLIQRVLRDNPNEPISTMAGKDERETLDEVQKYREDFAGLLAAGSRLMRLKGDERALFERRRIEASEEL